MKNVRKIMAGIAASITAITASLFVASPAQAAWSDCSNYAGTICLFANNNWGLPIWRQFPSQINGCRNLTGFDNVTTMALTQAPHHAVRLWENAGCTGQYYNLPNVGSYVDFSGSSWNDRASSIQVIAL
jgi:hypothetical protein